MAQDFQNYLNIFDPGIRTMFRMYRNNPSNQQAQDAREFMENVRTLAKTSLAGITPMLEYSQSIEGSKGFPSKLDAPLKRMQSSVPDNGRPEVSFTDWLAETEELGFNN